MRIDLAFYIMSKTLKWSKTRTDGINFSGTVGLFPIFYTFIYHTNLGPPRFSYHGIIKICLDLKTLVGGGLKYRVTMSVCISMDLQIQGNIIDQKSSLTKQLSNAILETLALNERQHYSQLSTNSVVYVFPVTYHSSTVPNMHYSLWLCVPYDLALCSKKDFLFPSIKLR